MSFAVTQLIWRGMLRSPFVGDQNVYLKSKKWHGMENHPGDLGRDSPGRGSSQSGK